MSSLRMRVSILSVVVLVFLVVAIKFGPVSNAGSGPGSGGPAAGSNAEGTLGTTITGTLGGNRNSAKMASDGQQSDISADALRQIEALEIEKENRTPAQKKMSSALLQALRESRGEQLARGVELEPSNFKADTAGMVFIDITAAVSDKLLARIESLGGEIVFASAEYKSIRARVPFTVVETIAGYSQVSFIRTAAPAKTNRAIPATDDSNFNIADPSTFIGPVTASGSRFQRRLTFAERAARVRSQLTKLMAARGAVAAPFIGNATSSGDKAHQADLAKLQYGFAGEGIRIGVMSDSFNYLGGAVLDIAGGDLPGPGNPFGNTTPVTVVQDLPIPNGIIAGSDEGRAMVQIVHDIAPKARLYFASAFISEAAFATNIKRLRDAPNSCDIVIDDVSYSDEGVFQDSIVAQAVNYVTASGGLYFSSAGNEGNVARNTASAWEGDFNDVGSVFVVPGNSKGGTVHNFGTAVTPVNGNILLSSSSFVYTIDWSDPLGASNNDYDLFVVNSTGTTVKAASTNLQAGTIDPHEEIGATAFTRATGDRLVIFKTTAAAVRAISMNANAGRLTVFTGGNTHGHGSAADAFSVAAAAASAGNTTSGVFTTASRVETFSSDGPRRVFYDPTGTPITPGNILIGTNGGVIRQKPDVTAADGVATSGNLLGAGLNPFSGTSAAAPHAGAIAGLIKSANPGLSAAQIRTILTAAANTIPIETGTAGAAPNPVAGYGILNANADVLAAAMQQADLTLGPVTSTEGAYSNANSIIEPGESANIVIQLNDPSLTAAVGVNATLSTTNPNVTILQPSAGYGTITAGGNATNSGTPFVVQFSQNFPCGSPVTFTVTAALTNGSTVVSPISVTVGGAVSTFVGPIAGTLSLTAPTGAGFTSADGTKTGTMARAGGAASCAIPKAAPLSGTGFSTTTGGRYAAFTFANPSAGAQCFAVAATSGTAANLQTATFNNAGFVPATSLGTGTNYLADSGTRASTMNYSFVVPGSQSFTTVIYDATTGGTAGATTYTLTVSKAACAAGPVCTPVSITTPSIPAGSTGSTYSQAFAATGGSGNYSFSLSGALPAGLSFSGNTLSGTPTQAGSFPIAVTATDAGGCPNTPANFTLVIAGTTPASIAVSAGDAQSVLPGAAFPTALKAIVRDGSSNPLSGVSVTFAAPGAGASGTFAGGSTTATVVSDAGGFATAPVFTANTTAGAYAVTATVAGLPTATFSLSNSCPGSFVVTSSADSGPGSLRSIVSNACSGATVTFSSTISSIVLTGGELVISKSITINGPGANLLSISGNHATRVFTVSAGASVVNISGLTIKDGSTRPDGTDFYGGGGVLIINGTVNLADLSINGNSATNSGNPNGGGVDNEGGTVTITRSTISGNTVVNNVASNGAFYFGGGVFSTGTSMTIANSTITGNVCGPFGNGGGLAFNTAVTLSNSTVAGNSANKGGNIFRIAGTLAFGSNIIAGGTLVGIGGVGPDLNGTAGLSSADFNLIQSTAGATITGTTTNNITGSNPNLLPLGYYGGAMQTLGLTAASAAINTGNPVGAPATDQRGAARVGNPDIGAFELNNAANGGAYFAPITNGQVNAPYSFTITGNSGTYSYTMTGGALPPGLSFSSALAPSAVVSINGTPLLTGTYDFAVTATDGVNTNITNYRLIVQAPTAAGVSVSGRALTVDGRGVKGAIVDLTDLRGRSQAVLTNAFGYYQFDGLIAGETYVLGVEAKRYSFASRSIQVFDSLTDVDMVASP